MGLFANIKGKSATKGGVYFKPGQFRVRVNRVMTGKRRENQEDYFLVDCEIVESNNADLPVGAKPGWMVLFRNRDTALGNIASFARAGKYAALVQNGVDPEVDSFEDMELEEDDLEEIIGEENPLAGVELIADAATIKTKAGNDFTKVMWSPPAE